MSYWLFIDDIGLAAINFKLGYEKSGYEKYTALGCEIGVQENRLA
jgi:hypothetical protein